MMKLSNRFDYKNKKKQRALINVLIGNYWYIYYIYIIYILYNIY